MGDLRESRAATRQRETGTARERAVRRWLPIALRTAACLLVPWIVVLGLSVRRFGARNLANSWVWLDVIEVAALLLLAALVRRRHRATSPLASATAVLLGMDAFFDLWSAHHGSDYLLAQVLAYSAELPSAAALALLSWYALPWAARNEGPTGTAHHPESEIRRQ